MSQPARNNAPPPRRSPIRGLNSPQMRSVRKELLLLRADVERAEFTRARADVRRSIRSFGWLKLLLPGFVRAKAKSSGKGVNATLSDWISNHRLASSLVSLVLAKPLRSTLVTGAKPLVKWGMLGAAAWAGYRLLAQTIRRARAKSAPEADKAH
ncbi:MAG: hypothetical protein QOI13_1878 [Paraburkholderia sp.]|nr:hypothetical protein [Paraburkholderia sp.]